MRLRYRRLSQYEDYRTEEMQPEASGRYMAAIPGASITAEWDLIYCVEAMDNAGNGRIFPDFEVQQPYVVGVKRAAAARPPLGCAPDRSIARHDRP